MTNSQIELVAGPAPLVFTNSTLGIIFFLS